MNFITTQAKPHAVGKNGAETPQHRDPRILRLPVVGHRIRDPMTPATFLRLHHIKAMSLLDSLVGCAKQFAESADEAYDDRRGEKDQY